MSQPFFVAGGYENFTVDAAKGFGVGVVDELLQIKHENRLYFFRKLFRDCS